MGAVNDGSYGDGDVVAKTAPGDLSNSFPLEGGQQVVTGIDLRDLRAWSTESNVST